MAWGTFQIAAASCVLVAAAAATLMACDPGAARERPLVDLLPKRLAGVALLPARVTGVGDESLMRSFAASVGAADISGRWRCVLRRGLEPLEHRELRKLFARLA